MRPLFFFPRPCPSCQPIAFSIRDPLLLPLIGFSGSTATSADISFRYFSFIGFGSTGSSFPHFLRRSSALSTYCPSRRLRTSICSVLKMERIFVSRLLLCSSDTCWCFANWSFDVNCRLQRRQRSLDQSISLHSSSRLTTAGSITASGSTSAMVLTGYSGSAMSLESPGLTGSGGNPVCSVTGLLIAFWFKLLAHFLHVLCDLFRPFSLCPESSQPFDPLQSLVRRKHFPGAGMSDTRRSSTGTAESQN